ncbi:hypothetical protein ADUPG1_006007, partial [Aduncisulcus paluster]
MSSSTDAVIQTVKPEFIHEGNYPCCPIPGDAPNIKSAAFPTIKAIDGTKGRGGCEYDQSSEAQDMMKGEANIGHFTHISIPFSSSSPMKGTYICLYGDSLSPSHIIFTLTSSKGDKTLKKYEFPGFKGWHWYFLHVDLPDVVLCEITGKGREEDREETFEETLSREVKEKLWSEAPVVKPEFVKEGGRKSIPIPRDDPKLVNPSFSMIKCKDDAYSKESEKYDQSSRAQKMLKGENGVCLSHLSVPFPSPSPMKGAYICVDDDYSSPSLLFTFTDCDGKKINKKYEFTRPEYYLEWYFLPIDLNNVVLCEIEGKGRWNDEKSRYFCIYSLVFLRGDDIPTSPPLLTPVPVSSSSSKTPTSTLSLPSKPVKEEKEEVVIKGNDKDPRPKDTKQKKHNDKVSAVEPTVSAEGNKFIMVDKSELIFPVTSEKQTSSFRITNVSPNALIYKVRTNKPKDFSVAKHFNVIQPHSTAEVQVFLSNGIELSKSPKVPKFQVIAATLTEMQSAIITECQDEAEKLILMCDIIDQQPSSTKSDERILVRFDGEHTAHLSGTAFEVDRSGDAQEEHDLKGELEQAIKEKQQKITETDKKKHNPKDGKPKYNPKYDSLTLTSASTLTSQCIIGSGGFGEVLLVLIDGIPFPCVLKKMLRIADKTVVKGCRKEFKVQLKLFNNPKCFNRIPRPLYILDLLDCDMKGVYGFLMEFCVGGSVSAFAKRWCADGKYVSVDDTADDSEPSDSDSDSDLDSDPDSSSSSGSGSESADVDTAVPNFDAMTLNPVKV